MTVEKEQHMIIGFIGHGNLATSLGAAWASAGHTIVLAGRDSSRAAAAARRLGNGAEAAEPAQLAGRCDVAVVAVPWDGLEEALTLAGDPGGALAGTPVIDCTNAVDHSSGLLHPPTGSAAQTVAGLAVGAHVVKALHLFAGAMWPCAGADPRLAVPHV